MEAEVPEENSAGNELSTVVPAVVGCLTVLVLMSITFEHGKEKLVHFAKKRRLERIVTVLFGGSGTPWGSRFRHCSTPILCRADITWFHRLSNIYCAKG